MDRPAGNGGVYGQAPGPRRARHWWSMVAGSGPASRLCPSGVLPRRAHAPVVPAHGVRGRPIAAAPLRRRLRAVGPRQGRRGGRHRRTIDLLLPCP
eukprot:6132009-Pyramimonas_sp.AAC.1